MTELLAGDANEGEDKISAELGIFLEYNPIKKRKNITRLKIILIISLLKILSKSESNN